MTPEPAPKVVMDVNGAYWRDYGDTLSMCPTSTANEATELAATYVPANDYAVVEASASALHDALLECAVIAGADPTAQLGPLDEWVTACVTALADQAREVARERDLLREELRRETNDKEQA